MKHRIRGFTLLEVMIVIAIIGFVATFAVPAFQKVVERNRLKEAAESLRADMQFARTQAIKFSRDVIVNRSTGNNGAWCYGMDDDGNCDCTVTNPALAGYCNIKKVEGNQFPSTNLVYQSGNTTIGFRRGTANSGNTCFSTTNYKLKVVVNNVGKTEVCTGTVNTVPGYETCSTNCP